MAGYGGQKQFYGGGGGYNKYIGTTEQKWASYLADLLFDTKYAFGVLWGELRSSGKANPETLRSFMQNFLELYLTTREFIKDKKLIESADAVFRNSKLELNNRLTKGEVEGILALYMDYNSAIYHTKALLEIIHESSTGRIE